jgi:hypothetical protein
MKKFLLAATAVAALGAATPASAQNVGQMIEQGLRGILGGGSGQLERLDDRIQQAFARGEISRDEAQRLANEFEQLRRLDRDFRRDGLSRDERFELERRVDQLERRIEGARLNRDGRYDNDRDRDGRFDRRDRDDRYDYDDRDRNGRFARGGRGNGVGRNGCPPGLARRDNGCQPPGQARRGDRDLNRGRFSDETRVNRDSDRFIFQPQADGTVLQIDRRTGQVVRVIRGR